MKKVNLMKRIITSVAIIMLICVASAWAAPFNTVPDRVAAGQGNVVDPGQPADLAGVVATHQTIQDQRDAIREDAVDTHQDISENRTAGHENNQDQRQAMRSDVSQNREDVRDNLTTVGEAREDIHENLTAGHEEIHGQWVATRTFVHQSRVTLAHNVTEWRSEIRAEHDADYAQIGNLAEGQRRGLDHMYDSQVAAHALMEMRNLTGDIGPRVADIAEDLNTSAGTVQPLEERIQDRNAVIRFFAGGDRDAADQINDQVAQNQQRIQDLEGLMANASLQPDVQQAMQDQITTLQTEQARLSDLARPNRMPPACSGGSGGKLFFSRGRNQRDRAFFDKNENKKPVPGSKCLFSVGTLLGEPECPYMKEGLSKPPPSAGPRPGSSGCTPRPGKPRRTGSHPWPDSPTEMVFESRMFPFEMSMSSDVRDHVPGGHITGVIYRSIRFPVTPEAKVPVILDLGDRGREVSRGDDRGRGLRCAAGNQDEGDGEENEGNGSKHTTRWAGEDKCFFGLPVPGGEDREGRADVRLRWPK